MNIKCFISFSFFAAASLSGGLAFDTALQYTLNQSNQLKSSLSAIEAREGDRIESGLFLNPLFSYSVENVLGTRNWRGWRAAESRYEFSQGIPISCHRQYRSNLACYKIHAAEFEYCYLELKTVNALKKAFFEVAAAEEMLKVARQQQEAADQIFKITLDKLENGKISLMEKNKAALELAKSRILWERACVNLDVARCKLVYFWNGQDPDFDCVECPFFEWDCLPSLEESMAYHDSHPLLLKTQFDQLAACEEAKLEKALAMPNVIVTAGYKTLNDTKDKGLILGFAIPLPFFDRNQGNIHRANAQSCTLLTDYADLKQQLEYRLIALHKEGMQAYQELVQFKTTILDLAAEAFSAAKTGYEAGRYEYLDLLDAEKTFFSAQESYIQALLLFFQKQTDIEYLTL